MSNILYSSTGEKLMESRGLNNFTENGENIIHKILDEGRQTRLRWEIRLKKNIYKPHEKRRARI